MPNNNKRRSSQLRSKRFYKYFLSYISLLLILLMVVGGVVYNSFVTTLQREVESANITAMMQLMISVDMRLKEMERMAIQALSNPKLTPFLLSNGGYDTFEGVRELQQYRSSNTFIYDIILYYDYGGRNANMIYSSKGAYKLDNFFNYVYNYREWDEAGFKTGLSKLKSPVMRPLEPVKIDNINNENLATYLYPLSANAGKSSGALMFLIEEDTLEDMMRGLLHGYNGFVYILDQDGRAVASFQNGGMAFNTQDIYGVLNINLITDPVSTATIGDRDFSVVKLFSDYNKWSYVMVMPKDQFMYEVFESQRIFNTTVIVLFIIGLLAAILFSIDNYKPWRKLLSALSEGKENKEVVYKRDEMDYIYDAIGDIKRQNQEMSFQLKSQAKLVQEQFIMALLKGKFNNRQEMKDMMDMAVIDVEKAYYATALFLIDDYESFERDNDRSMQELLKINIIDVIEGLSQEIGYGYGMDLGDNQGIALLLNSDDEDIERRLSALSYKAKDFFEHRFKVSLTVGIGGVYEDILETSYSFKEASSAAHYRIIIGGNQVIFYKDIKNTYKDKYWYPVEQEERLAAAIKRGDSIETERLVKNIMEEMRKHRFTPQIVQCICFGIVNKIMATISQIGIIEYSSIGENTEGSIIPYFDTLEAIESKMVHFAIKASEYVTRYKEDNKFDIINEIMEYAQKNYYRVDVSLDSISSEFGLSQSYITRIFKERTGCTLMHYIDNMRMNKVKELLKETNLYLKEILDKVGYGNEATFISRFKKIEGMTPIQYRNRYRASESK